MSDHKCHAVGCTRNVPPRMFACLPHWRMVPTWLQQALWKVYKPGQESDHRQVTALYMTVQTRCRLAIAEQEGREEATWLRTELLGRIRARIESAATMTDEQVLNAWDNFLRSRP